MVTRARPVGFRRSSVLALLTLWVALGGVSACSSESAPKATSTTSKSTAATGPVVATSPAVPPATRDCGTRSELAGWPTTTGPPPDANACILEAFAAGTPAQMSVTFVGGGDSGRKTQDGYDIPTRRIVTWLVLGKNEVQVTTDLTEDGGTSSIETCTGLVMDGYQSPPKATGCS